MSKSNFTLMLFGAVILMGFLGASQTEYFMQKSAGLPLDSPAMGPYDTSMGGWMSSEYMPVASLPQNKSVDENKLMFLVGNEVDHECCPSAFTTDTGCVCLTNQDKNFMASRGGNK
jgi:hypothetical protein